MSAKANAATRTAASRNKTSPLWVIFASGMSSIDLAQATHGATARPTAARFLESAVASGAAVRRKENGIVRYWKTDEAPQEPVKGYVPGNMPPLRQAFPGNRVIPVRAGGVEMPVCWQGRSYETVGERGVL